MLGVNASLRSYSECAELSGAPLLPDGNDLGELAGNAERTSSGLEIAQCSHVHDSLGEQGSNASSQDRDKERRHAGIAAVLQDQNCNDDILAEDERGLAVRAEGKPVADIVREADQVAGRLEQVR